MTVVVAKVQNKREDSSHGSVTVGVTLASSYHGRVWRLVDPAGDVDPAPLVSHHPAVVRRDECDGVNLVEKNKFKVMFYMNIRSYLGQNARAKVQGRASRAHSVP